MNNEIGKEISDRREMTSEENIVEMVQDADRRNFVKDAAYAIQICRRFLKVLGIWPITDAGAFLWRAILGNMSVVVCYFGIGIRGIPTSLYLILDEKRPIERLRLIVRCLFVFMAAAKYTLLRSHRRNIEKCMKHIEHDWLKVECATSRDIMLERARFGHLLTRICVVFTYVSATFLALLPIVAARLRDDKTHSINSTETVYVRKFTVPSHFGYSIFTESPIYEIIYSSQVIATFVLHSISIACYSLAVVIVMHACGQLKILMEKLNELVDGGCKMTMYNSVDSRMSDIIKHHVMALRLVSSAEKMLREICLIDVLGYTFQVCCLGYFSLLEFRAETKQPIAICAWTTISITFVFNVFSFCYIGELLTQECKKVGEITYMIEWHRLPGKQPLDLGLIITMAHSPATLTAGGATQLSMKFFANVMRTILGYVNMLRTVMD